MYPIFCFIVLLLATVSGHRIRGSQRTRTLDTDINETDPSYENSLSFLYEVPSTTASTTASTTSSTTQEVPESTLIGTRWTAVEINSLLLNEDSITLSFDSRNTMSGNSGCNRYRGNFEVLSDNSFRSADEFATTKMYCNAPGAMEQEGSYLMFMKSKVFFYEVVSGELVLYDDTTGEGGLVKGAILARFVQGDGDAQAETEKTRR
mmetsp:Transcript_10585/g.19123  ORF Transcript_10585/g.19123 Transcript_10585/m.19123 type:complete len:206 (+) Transcript_10585:118-735(+)